MNQTPSPAYILFEQRTKEKLNKNSTTPLFADWLHSTLQIDMSPANYPPDPVILPHPTSTKSGIVVMCIPSLLQPSQFRGISSSIHCWTKSSTESTANPQQEIAKAIIQQYSTCVHNIKIVARVNPSMNDFKASFTNQNVNPDSRFLFHYSQYGASGITPQSIVIQSSPDISSSDQYPIENILNSTATCSLHIIDCDNAGLLLPTYEKFVNTRNSEKLKTDIFAFFSCGALEKLPRSPGLPFDLFTSCITTPARTALLWHSRHYYCFKNGPLRPLPIDFFDQASPQIMNEITITLHRLVEAMAYEVFEPELFLKVFHSDSTIAHFAANFYLASRIFSFFNVAPLSYPPLPDLRKNQLWHSFDLRLDVALLQLNSNLNSSQPINKSPSLTFSAYLEQSLKTLKHLLAVATKDISFPSQLTQLPLALTASDDLQKEACEVIALYIDKSINAIKQLLYFPIVFPLFQLLPKRIGGESLLFSLSKILCFMPQTREMLNSLSHSVIEELIFPLLDEEKPLFALISATLITRYNQQVISSLNNNWKKTVLPLLKNKHQDVKIWTLLFLSSFIQHVDDYKVALVPIFILLNDDSPEVRLVALYTLCCFSGRGLDSNITPSICKLCTDASVAVRLQLLCTMTHFEEDKYVEEALQIFHNDPHPDVQVKQSEVVEFLKVKKAHNLNKNSNSSSSPASVMQSGMKTFIFEWYSSAVLNQISPLLTDPSLLLSEVQQTSVKLTKHESITVPRAEFKKMQVSPTVVCDSPISTNFSNTNSGEFVFGTRNGELALGKWGEQKKPVLKQVTKCPLSHVQFISNNSFPLTLVTNNAGYLQAFQFNEKEVKHTACFRICYGSCEFECDELDRKIYVVPTIQQESSSSSTSSSSSSYLPQNAMESGSSSKAMIYDIQKEKMVGNVSSRWGRVRKIHTFSTMRDVIAVCSEKFEIYDIRTDTSNSVVTYDKSGTSAFDVGHLDQPLSSPSSSTYNASSPSLSLSEYFALGHQNSAVSLIDIRVQEPVKTFQLASEDSATFSFGVQAESGTAAIGNAKGLFMIDLFHDKKSEITVASQNFFSKSKKIQNVKQFIFHKHKFRLALLQEPNEIITFIEDS